MDKLQLEFLYIDMARIRESHGGQMGKAIIR